MSDSQSMEGKCSFCPRWFGLPDDGAIPRHTVTRGTDLYVCQGSRKDPMNTRVVQ